MPLRAWTRCRNGAAVQFGGNGADGLKACRLYLVYRRGQSCRETVCLLPVLRRKCVPAILPQYHAPAFRGGQSFFCALADLLAFVFGKSREQVNHQPVSVITGL